MKYVGVGNFGLEVVGVVAIFFVEDVDVIIVGVAGLSSLVCRLGIFDLREAINPEGVYEFPHIRWAGSSDGEDEGRTKAT